MNKIKCILFYFIVLSSCYRFYINVQPQDALILINGKKIKNNTIYKSNNKDLLIKVSRYGYKDNYINYHAVLPFIKNNINVILEKIHFNITVNIKNGKSEIYLDNKFVGVSPVSINLAYGNYDLTMRRKNFIDQKALLFVRRDGIYHLKHFNNESPAKIVGIFECGSEPKQVLFSPDSKSLLISLLDGDGYDFFDIETFNLKHIIIEEYGKYKGFVELICIKEKECFLISQMTLNKIYEFSISTQQLLRIFETHGIWSKFIAVNSSNGILTVSNWFSNNISVINYNTGALITTINTDASPRGLVFDKTGKFLYATCFDGGSILKIDTSNWIIIKRIKKNSSAMRHIVLTNDNKKLFVSDMHNCCVYEIDTDNFEITNSYKVYDNPNTIALTPDNRYLFVSCRGPNNPESYLKRSPENGAIVIIDLFKKKVKYRIEGGNQPTGLSISNDGKFLAFTNFKDNNFELYYIGDFYNEKNRSKIY